MFRSLAAPTLRSMQRAQPLASRTLVSSVLLSRDAYDAEKVANLKTELKQRGLSTNGKRADLIRRLLEDDKQKSGGSPAPSTPSSVTQPKARMASTKQATKSESSPKDARPSMSAGNVGVDGSAGPTVSHPPDMEPGQVSSNLGDAVERGIVPEKPVPVEANPPGVPPQSTPTAPVTFEVKIPYEAEVLDAGPEIPLVTAYFHPETPTYEAPPIKPPLKVITVSGDSTYPGGGVSHSGQDDTFADELPQSGQSSQSSDQSIRSALDGLVSAVRHDLGLSSTTETEQRLKSAAGSIIKEAREGVSRLGSGSSSASYSTSTVAASSGPDSYSGGRTRALSDEEQRGLYVLGGIVAGGFLLGSLGKPSKRRVERVKAEIEQIKRQTVNEDLAALVQRAEEALKAL